MQDLPSFLLAGLALAGSPGPANLSLAALGAAFGTRAGLAYQAGAVFGMLLVMLVTASGLAALLLALPGVRLAALVLGGGYIAWLAWRIATAPLPGAGTRPQRPPGFLGGCLLQLGNPKAYAAMAALFAGFVLQPGDPLRDALWKTLLLLAVIAVVTSAWLQFGRLLARLARRPRLLRAINIAFALLLVISTLLALPL